MMEQLLVLGDIHGEFEKTISLIKRVQIENAYVIQVGDFGVGFDDIFKEIDRLENLATYLKRRNIVMYAIRGNHDNPVYFNNWPNDYIDFYTTVKKYDKQRVLKVVDRINSLENIRFVEDYTVLDLLGSKILCVGGAVSVDRYERVKNKTWWSDEIIKLDKEKLANIEPVDYLIMHTIPTIVKNTIPDLLFDLTENKRKDQDLEYDLNKEFNDAEIIYQAVLSKGNLKRFYCGHFHKSVRTDIGSVQINVLDIDEFLTVI